MSSGAVFNFTFIGDFPTIFSGALRLTLRCSLGSSAAPDLRVTLSLVCSPRLQEMPSSYLLANPPSARPRTSTATMWQPPWLLDETMYQYDGDIQGMASPIFPVTDVELTHKVRAHEKIGIWRAIAKEVRGLGVHHRRGTHCRKRWEDIRRGTKKTAESLLGMASQRRRGACRQLSPLMFRILAVAYPDLDGRVRAAHQTQGGEYKHHLLCCRAVEVSGWGRRAVGPPRPGRYL
ncbi:hypothetical protein NDU88_002631 [Pleurodeles waltl]|uniref:Myb/SANT-like DNA-binding domain-containing protein n=1 Tax=Pleurodeles waltl TaxID=8319 RepID=A0AAV7P7J2_PLEWA|nr:hypothetical protein NDU88_002631 [Pleurodeles waltl]